MSEDRQSVPGGAAARPVRQKLLHQVCGDAAMFALGSSIARVVQMASSDDQGTHDLTFYVLSDAALTQKVLTLSNTVTYRNVSGTPVTTVSRAISLLGFDNVKTTAMAMLLVDTLINSAHAHSVRAELEIALCASLVGREAARRSHYHGAEEASIGALFKNLGPLLVASNEHQRYREISALVASGKHTPGQASQMILGCSYDALSEAVLSEWKIAPQIANAIVPIAPGVQKSAASRAEWMRQVASFSVDAAKLLARTGNPGASAEVHSLLSRYGEALNLDLEQLCALFETVRTERASMLESMNSQAQAHTRARAQTTPDDVGHSLPDDAGNNLPDVLLLATMAEDSHAAAGVHPSGKPTNARELLLAGVQDVTQMRAGGLARVNDLILAVLETLYRSMGFRFATVCLKDMKAGQYRARIAFGDDHARRQAGFLFPLETRRDLFHLAMENDADLMIADAANPKIRDLLPHWHQTLLPDARSFIVLPLVLGRVQLGLFYADRTATAPEGVPPDETSLIKALKGQVLAALGH